VDYSGMRRVLVSAFFLLCCPLTAIADDQSVDSFPLRHHNPFLQIYGLPAFQTAAVASPGGFVVGMSFDIMNDADDTESDTEQLIIDGETTTVALSVRRRILDRLELGIDVPYVRHSGGFLDGFIKDWHDLFGLSNARREGPEDQLRHSYVSNGTTLAGLDSSVSGIGDIQLSAAVPFSRVTVRASVKLPTGDPDKLTGSGAADFSLGVYGSRVYTFRGRDLSLSGFVGGLALGDGDVLPELQRSFVPYGGLALRWQATERFGLATQLSMQGSYIDTDFDDIGGNTLQLGFGADYRAGDFLWRFAFAEDLNAQATADFAMQLSVRYSSSQ
jgi:hypothetical protein